MSEEAPQMQRTPYPDFISSVPLLIAIVMFLLYSYSQIIKKPNLLVNELVRSPKGRAIPIKARKASTTAENTFGFQFFAWILASINYLWGNSFESNNLKGLSLCVRGHKMLERRVGA
jgi:hypothetical protein